MGLFSESFVAASVLCRCVSNLDPVISILSEIFRKHLGLKFQISPVCNLVACSGWQLFLIFGAELTVGHGLCYVMSYCSFRPAETERVCEQGLYFKG